MKAQCEARLVGWGNRPPSTCPDDADWRIQNHTHPEGAVACRNHIATFLVNRAPNVVTFLHTTDAG